MKCPIKNRGNCEIEYCNHHQRCYNEGQTAMPKTAIELTVEEELRLEELRESWRWADKPHPTEDDLYQAVIDERGD